MEQATQKLDLAQLLTQARIARERLARRRVLEAELANLAKVNNDAAWLKRVVSKHFNYSRGSFINEHQCRRLLDQCANRVAGEIVPQYQFLLEEWINSRLGGVLSDEDIVRLGDAALLVNHSKTSTLGAVGWLLSRVTARAGSREKYPDDDLGGGIEAVLQVVPTMLHMCYSEAVKAELDMLSAESRAAIDELKIP